ncbi:EAL domain-containing protein [Rahnella victoriana]|uniref:EAL domain-containing protein n=2 Tax=Rahnella victoriana TaxID=1510570 RepID=A0ABS0DKJ3_9GAMM|nr:EAL domain-containing protein [Rahnella victoriana]MBF7954422.1 EAL domain-containing protein [Rahnella victoriana]TBX30604.1 EAL domain-containing protein [Rahnella victoriana]
MRAVKRNYPGYLYEPIVSVTGEILGFELVQKVAKAESQENSDCYRGVFTSEEKVKIFFEQVTLACVHESLFIANNFLLSINVDYDTAVHIVSNPSIQKVLQQHKYIRLEINEDFLEFSAGQERPVLESLLTYCPLWLDNFGAGNTSLTLVMSEKFEYVKISKVFFWQHQGTQSLRKVIDHVRPYCSGVIMNGVENSQHIEYLSGSNIKAMQGALWLPYCQEELVNSFFK